MLTSEHIQDQFDNLTPDVRLVILHPAAHQMHRLFGQLLLKTTNVIYVHPQPSLSSEKDGLEAIGQAIAEQTGIDLLPDITPASIAETMQTADAQVLLLDGYDGAVEKYLNQAIASLIQLLSEGYRVVLSGRHMPSILWQTTIPVAQAALLPVDTQRMLVDYIHPEDDKTILEVRAFGQGQVWVNGEPVSRWEGYLPRALFFYFVDRAMVTRDEIFQTFWPSLKVREATNVFHVTKRKISEILDVNLTVYGSGFYRIAPSIDLYYDVVNFQEAVQEAEIANVEQAEGLYRIAIDLYRDRFLSSIEADWAARRREEMGATYTDALIGLARIRQDHGDDDEALGLYLRAAAIVPNREDLARSIMRIYDRLGKPELALDTYDRLVSVLQSQFGLTPDPQSIELMRKIRRKMQ